MEKTDAEIASVFCLWTKSDFVNRLTIAHLLHIVIAAGELMPESEITKRSVLLVGDVGVRDSGYYHVGDEAMLYQNYLLYERAGNFQTSTLTWATTPTHRFGDEHNFWEMPSGKEGEARIEELCRQARCARHFPFLPMPARLKEYVKLIGAQDLLHLSGGGNLNSLFPRELYARALIVRLAGIFEKPILVTSQTIGPLTDEADRRVAGTSLDAAAVITVRDRDDSPRVLKELGVTRPQISNAPDDAFFLESAPRDLLAPYLIQGRNETDKLKVGVSLHRWATGASGALSQIVTSALVDLAEYIPLEVYFIPHLFMDDNALDDGRYMREIADRLPPEIARRVITREDIEQYPQPVKEPLIKGLTAAMEMVIATRYHALVFAMSSGVPALSLNYDDYYATKNRGVLELMWGEDAGAFELCVNDLTADTLAAKLRRLVAERWRMGATLMAKRAELEPYADANLRFANQLIRPR